MQRVERIRRCVGACEGGGTQRAGERERESERAGVMSGGRAPASLALSTLLLLIYCVNMFCLLLLFAMTVSFLPL